MAPAVRSSGRRIPLRRRRGARPREWALHGGTRGGCVEVGERMDVSRDQGPGAGDQGMNKIRDYRDLTVWQRAMDLSVECYSASKHFPRVETYGMASQLRRAAVSIPSNIAEGNGRTTLGDYLRHLSVANGSLMELETHIQLAHRFGYLSGSQESRLLSSSLEIGRMLGRLMSSLRARRHLPGPRSRVPGPTRFRSRHSYPPCFGIPSVLP